MGCGASATPAPDMIGADVPLSAASGPLDSAGPQVQVQTFSAGSGNGTSPPLKVWLGFVKLDDKVPTKRALQKLLYNSAQGSAKDCDVVALLLTDLMLDDNKATTKRFRNLLKNALDTPEEYVINEDDPACSMKNIPAQLVTSKGGNPRYCSMHVAVHKRRMPENKTSCVTCTARVFPVPITIAAKSERR